MKERLKKFYEDNKKDILLASSATVVGGLWMTSGYLLGVHNNRPVDIKFRRYKETGEVFALAIAKSGREEWFLLGSDFTQFINPQE